MTDRSHDVFIYVCAAIVAMLVVAAITILATRHAGAGEVTTFQNSKGQQTGTATTRGSSTTFQNSLGQQTGRAVNGPNGTTLYNEKGQELGTARTRR